MAVPGAARHAVDIRFEDAEASGSAWLRYLQDHTSKRKQGQLVDSGRHWGIVGRRCFVRLLPESCDELSERDYAAVRRCVERLSTPRVRDDRDPFGVRLGYGSRRGRRGSSVCFVNPAVVSRLVAWAQSPDRVLSVPGNRTA